jgi:hypothetical protein
MRWLLAIFVLFVTACATPTPFAQPSTAPTDTPITRASPKNSPMPKAPLASATPTPAPTRATLSSAGSGVLLFTIGVHIEPLGATVSALVPNTKAGNVRQGASYTIVNIFNNHVNDLKTLASIVERHDGRMTIQAQSPFTTAAIQNKNNVLAEFEARGHEIGLHFHEDAHLGQNSEQLSADVWCAVMQEEIGYIKQAGVKGQVRYWSGGNLYANLLDAAACAGLEVNSDWKNPHTQATDPALIGIHPWRPAGGVNGTDVSQFARHDQNGKIIFLPEGLYARNDFASMRRAQTAGGDEAYFQFLKDNFLASLAAAEANKVNVFHFTVHPGEFKGDSRNPFAVIDQFLTNVVDPQVRAGKVKWATFGEMADAYKTSQQSSVVSQQSIAQSPHHLITQCPNGYLTFAINTHDLRYVSSSADTLLRLIGIFEKNNARGDFYLTAPLVELYAKQRPDVIARLRDSAMTISYHVRPPHPAYPGFDARLRTLDDKTLEQTLRDYETYRMDLTTGNLDKSQPGGYAYVAQVFGRKPVVASPMSGDPRIRAMMLKIYAEMGAQMLVAYHEQGTSITNPFVFEQGLLQRPSDFSVTRWGNSPPNDKEGKGSFWWNMIFTPRAAEYNPVNYLKTRLAEWNAPRAPFVTALIHEDNFYRSGTPWRTFFFDANDKPLTPPYNLNAPDDSRARSKEQTETIFKTYEELVAYAAKNLCVVTSADIVALAKGTK